MSGAQPPRATVRIERTFRAPARAVFEAWTSEEVLRRWWHAERHWETPSAEVDLRVGGSIRVTMRDTDLDEEHGGGGEFTVIDPPLRLAFTWTWDDDPSTRQLIEVEFIDHGDSTTVVLTNSGVPEAAKDDHHVGWQTSFDNLDEALLSS
jgi:uncharacterized protein YndB with AHSA1/START domain